MRVFLHAYLSENTRALCSMLCCSSHAFQMLFFLLTLCDSPLAFPLCMLSSVLSAFFCAPRSLTFAACCTFFFHVSFFFLFFRSMHASFSSFFAVSLSSTRACVLPPAPVTRTHSQQLKRSQQNARNGAADNDEDSDDDGPQPMSAGNANASSKTQQHQQPSGDDSDEDEGPSLAMAATGDDDGDDDVFAADSAAPEVDPNFDRVVDLAHPDAEVPRGERAIGGEWLRVELEFGGQCLAGSSGRFVQLVRALAFSARPSVVAWEGCCKDFTAVFVEFLVFVEPCHGLSFMAPFARHFILVVSRSFSPFLACM